MVLSLIVHSIHSRNDRNKNWYAVLRNPVHPKSVMHFLSYFSNFPFDLIGFSGKFRSDHKLYTCISIFFLQFKTIWFTSSKPLYRTERKNNVHKKKSYSKTENEMSATHNKMQWIRYCVIFTFFSSRIIYIFFGSSHITCGLVF